MKTLTNLLASDKYKLEIIPTYNPAKQYVIKTYLKGGVQTVNQIINGKLFYRKWEQYSRSSVAIVRRAK